MTTPRNSKLSRQAVDEALARRNTNFAAFVEGGRSQGKTIEEIWIDLRSVTGVLISVRTMYRWVEAIEAKEAS